MGIFDDVVVNAKAAANVVGKKANTFVDISKLKFTASGLTNDIHKKYKLLGQEIYTATKNGTINDYDPSKIITEIDDLVAQLEKTNELIMSAKNKVICPECGAELDNSGAFCSNCGAKLHNKEADSKDKDEVSADDSENEENNFDSEESFNSQEAENQE